MGERAIEVERLRKTFGDTVAVSGVSFTVEQGSIVGLLGTNGAGKTTTIGCLSTLLRPDSGTAKVAGYDVVTAANEVRRRIATTGQYAAVDTLLTGRDNLVFFSRLQGLSRKDATRRTDELLERIGLGGAADKRVVTYSGGMRRRLDLAVSLVVPRPVLFLDEPTTGLDPASRLTLWEIVRELCVESGTAVLLTTHYLDEVERLAQRVVVLDKGVVVADAPTRELTQQAGAALFELRFVDEPALRQALVVLKERGRQATIDDDALITSVDSRQGALGELVALLDGQCLCPVDMSSRRLSLDDVFLQLTGWKATPPTSVETT